MQSKTTEIKENKLRRVELLLHICIFFLSHPKHLILKQIDGRQLVKVLEIATSWETKGKAMVQVLEKSSTKPNDVAH